MTSRESNVFYNFRFDREQLQVVLDRLRNEKVLSQGWSGHKGDNLPVTTDDFIPRCKATYNLATTRVPSNLTWMRSFRDGDVLVVPHLPDYGRVSMHVVDGDFPKCYEYRVDDSTHLGHAIRVKESVGLDGEISIHNLHLTGWYAKLQWLRLPIIRVPQFEPELSFVLDRARKGEKFGRSGMDDFLASITDDALAAIRSKLQKVSPAGGPISFEGVCERLLVSHGYEIVGRNEYDGKGSDVDLRCVRKHGDATPFESGQVTLVVQVKRHEGESGPEAVQQLVKVVGEDPSTQGCVMSLGESFSSEAEALADDNGIVLMDGSTISRLLLRVLGSA